MEEKNVYDRARRVVRELVPVLHTIREHDKSLADQLKRAAQSVVLNIAEARGSDAGNARARFSTACGSAKEVRAALNVASDWGYIETQRATRESPGHRADFIERDVHPQKGEARTPLTRKKEITKTKSSHRDTGSAAGTDTGTD
jgi:four helix bundle protein